ncbi:MAG: bifunctional nuclease family protein [Bacillota bacterium]
MIEVTVERVAVDPQGDQGVVILKAPNGTLLPIWIGLLEATAIALELEGVKPLRPLTHDLLKTILDVLGASVERVSITELRDSTFFGEVVLAVDDAHIPIDARPSDCIALALRAGAPIMVDEEVMKEAGSPPPESSAVH